MGNNINDVTHTIEATCTTFGDVTMLKDMNGKDVQRPMRSGKLKASAQLGLCDVREEALPQAMEDARNVAAHHLEHRDKNAYRVDPKNLECTFAVHPR